MMAAVMVLVGIPSSLGYGAWASVKLFGMAFLDFFDFLSNSVLMPLAAFATCLLVLRVVGFDRIEEEVTLSAPFRRQRLYRFFLKYLAPVCIAVIFLTSIADVLGIISL